MEGAAYSYLARILDVHLRRIFHSNGSISAEEHIPLFFLYCCSHTTSFFQPYEAHSFSLLPIPVLSSRLFSIHDFILHILHLDGYHLRGRDERERAPRLVWQSVAEGEVGRILQQDTRQAIIELSSRHLHDLQASCTNSSPSLSIHIISLLLRIIIFHTCQTRCTGSLVTHSQSYTP